MPVMQPISDVFKEEYEEQPGIKWLKNNQVLGGPPVKCYDLNVCQLAYQIF
jgi:hypothetical protein